MNINLARLRKKAATRQDNSTPESRDTLIITFLDEFQAVVCNDVIDSVSDETLHCLHMDWIKAVLAGETDEERHNRLISAVMVFPVTKGAQPVTPLSASVESQKESAKRISRKPLLRVVK